MELQRTHKHYALFFDISPFDLGLLDELSRDIHSSLNVMLFIDVKRLTKGGAIIGVYILDNLEETQVRDISREIERYLIKNGLKIRKRYTRVWLY